MLRGEQIGGKKDYAVFTADIHKLAFYEPQGRNAGLLWTRAVWAAAEHKVQSCVISLSLTYLKLFPHIHCSNANSLSVTEHHWLQLVPAVDWSKRWHIFLVAFRFL